MEICMDMPWTDLAIIKSTDQTMVIQDWVTKNSQNHQPPKPISRRCLSMVCLLPVRLESPVIFMLESHVWLENIPNGVWNFVRAWFLGSICVQPLLWVRGHPRSVQKYGVKKTWLKNTYQAPTSNAWKMHRTYVKNNPMKMQKVYKPKMQHMQNLWKYSDWCFEYKHTSIGKGRWTLN